MPAVTTELEWTIEHVLKFMIQTGRFRNPNGTIADDRVEAAQAYLQTDWNDFMSARLAIPNFDPERPNIDPAWKQDTKLTTGLAKYMQMKDSKEDQMSTFMGGPNKEYTRAVNALLMAQRVDLWCAGEKEVELAVQHLYKLGRLLNERETEFPTFIKEFYPGAEDI